MAMAKGPWPFTPSVMLEPSSSRVMHRDKTFHNSEGELLLTADDPKIRNRKQEPIEIAMANMAAMSTAINKELK